jgi:hypothetical protein
VPTADVHLEVGDSFILLDQNGKHLHIIVAESSPEDSATIMLVYLSSARISNRDTTTMLHTGDHPFIDRECWVRYQNILVCSRETVEPMIVEHFGKVEDRLLERIQAGIEKSKFASKQNKDLFRQWRIDRTYRHMQN